MKRAIALIDGEHYPNVVREALEEVAAVYDLRAAVFLGGTEKIDTSLAGDAGQNEYGVPVFLHPDPLEAFTEALRKHDPEVVVDLSDEPVLGYRERFWYASHALAAGARYQGADFTLLPPSFHKLSRKPSISVIGTGKRIGKTAVSGFLARAINESFAGGGRGSVAVVAMGRGGPPDPELITGGERRLGVADLLSFSRQGKHAASDYLEDAALSFVTTIGCRRCGGGLAGMPFVSNVVQGAELAEALPAPLIIFEGSGSALPPIKANRILCVAGADQPEEYLLGLLGTYRMLISDAVLLTMCEEPLASPAKVERLITGIKKINPGATVVPVVLRPKPAADIRGARVAYFTTAQPAVNERIAAYLADTYGCLVKFVSSELANRGRLRDQLVDLKQGEADIFLTEIKAAAVDIVAEEADRRGIRVVFCDNVPVEAGGGGLLAPLPSELARQAMAEFGGTDV
ncbi:MAG: 2,3-diphosphoglycerate synthetase [Actinobacteria bacterium]|nr:2,3-diphosphoglycerate synthetase [Actinomycetota bacterium]